MDAGFEEGDGGHGDGVPAHEVVDADAVIGEFADGDAGAFDGEGLDDGVHAGAVAEAGIDEGLAAINAASEGGDDAFDDGEAGFFGGECLGYFCDAAVAFDVDVAWIDDHDFGDGG